MGRYRTSFEDADFVSEFASCRQPPAIWQRIAVLRFYGVHHHQLVLVVLDFQYRPVGKMHQHKHRSQCDKTVTRSTENSVVLQQNASFEKDKQLSLYQYLCLLHQLVCNTYQ